jgi:hypothetical protein
LRLMRDNLVLRPEINYGTRIIRWIRWLLDRGKTRGQMDEPKVGEGFTVPLVEVADTKGRARLAQSDHPDPDEGVIAPGTNLLDPEEGIAKLINTGFPLNTVGLMHSMFAQFDDASGITKKGGDPIRGEINDDVPRRRNGSRRGGMDGLSASASKVPGARADRSDPSRQASKPTLARFR